MNNSKYFRELMLTITKLDAPKSVYISDGQNRLEHPIPIKGSLSVDELNLVKRITKEKGQQALNNVMLTIAEKIAEQNGGDKLKVLNPLINFSQGKTPDLGDYQAYALLYCEQEYEQYMELVQDSNIDDWEAAACAHALLLRIPATPEFNPLEWKTEMGLNNELLPRKLLLQLLSLFRLESMGADLSKYINEKNEFTWKPDTKTTEEKPETVEELAGKS
jgi:hypothetical protein